MSPSKAAPAEGECWVSVDVETAGPNPSSYSLLSIGACLYEDLNVTFSIDLVPDRDAVVESALEVSGLSMAELAATGTPPEQAMAAFEQWLASVVPSGSRPVFVGFNAAFDWMFVCDYFHRYLGRNPFGHAAIDIKAVALGVGGLTWPETSLKYLSGRFLGGRTLSHNALRDAQDQGALLRAVLEGPE